MCATNVAMASVFVVAGVVSAVFVLAKFLEMRFIEKESKPFKFIVRDALVVYFSVIAANFVMVQVHDALEVGGSGGKQVTPVFTDNPGF